MSTALQKLPLPSATLAQQQAYLEDGELIEALADAIEAEGKASGDVVAWDATDPRFTATCKVNTQTRHLSVTLVANAQHITVLDSEGFTYQRGGWLQWLLSQHASLKTQRDVLAAQERMVERARARRMQGVLDGVD